jgi:filamentous hemagglutinin family protein
MKPVTSCLWVASSIALGCLATVSSITAQIVPDNTLPVNSSVTPGCTVCTIDGGTIRGTNLFHSFQSFSVPTGGEAFFNNALQIQNILTRVTGNSVSNIDGLIGANGTANLFLLNPNGISFGANATLNLGGSFIASTASSLVFADGTVFNAKPDTSTPPLLTISVPLGLQYGSNPGSIQVQGATLEVGVGQTLALVGGNVSLEGGQLLALGGRVELGGLAGEGTVGLVANGPYLGLSFPVGVVRGDVSLSNGVQVNVRAGGGGTIGVNAFNLTMTQGSQLLAGIASGRGAVDAVAGDIEINATGAIDLAAQSGIYNSVRPTAQGQGGDVKITTSQLRVSGGSQVRASTFGQGDGGNLTVNASTEVQLIGESADGEDVSGLFASVEQGSSGNAGELRINTGTMLVRDGAVVSASTFGQGNGGKLTVNASKGVQLIGESADGRVYSGLFARSNRDASGNAGDLTINTDTLLVRDGALVSAGTFSEGDGGNLTVNASNQVQLIGTSANGRVSSGLFASAEQGSSGKAGDLTINTGTMLVRDGAVVSASTFGQGDGGKLTVNASTEVQLIGTSANGQTSRGLYAQANQGASGKAGDLTINTDTLLVGDGAVVSVRSFQGQAGNMTILANSVHLNRGTLIAATAKSDAQGGANITLRGLDLLRMDNESLISANAFNQANGGNITIGSTFIVATPPTGPQGSDITANAGKGNGGVVNITTQGLFGIKFRPQLTPKNDITVSSKFGVAGQVNVNQLAVDPTQGLAQLPETLTDPSNQIVTGCAAAQGNSFIVTGRGGLPEDPTATIRGQTVWRDFQDFSQGTGVGQASPQNPQALMGKPSPRLVEANSWVYGANGEVILTATARTLTPHGTWQPPVNCPQVSQTDSH